MLISHREAAIKSNQELRHRNCQEEKSVVGVVTDDIRASLDGCNAFYADLLISGTAHSLRVEK